MIKQLLITPIRQPVIVSGMCESVSVRPAPSTKPASIVLIHNNGVEEVLAPGEGRTFRRGALGRHFQSGETVAEVRTSAPDQSLRAYQEEM